MNNIIKVFVDARGELNTCWKGKMASIEHLEDSICCGQEPVLGLLQTATGVFKWVSVEDQRKIIMMDEDITEEELEELEECSGEYIKINSGVPTLYNSFISDLDELLEEVLTVNVDDDDKMLVATTRLYNSKFIHTHNYFYKDNEIVKNTVLIPTVMIGMSLSNISLESLV